MRAAAGAAVSARRVIALMVVRVNIFALLSSWPDDAGTRLKRRYRRPCAVLPESVGRRQGGRNAYFSASNAARHFSN